MTLDPDAARILEAVRKVGRPPFEALSPDAARQQYNAGRAAVAPDPEPVGNVTTRQIDGPGGQLAIRLYRPIGAGAGPLPALLYFHGGGWVLGDLESHDGVCRSLSNQAGCVTVSVDYRLAPEAQFPAAVEDAWAALAWVVAEAAELGIDATRIAVGGDSAGGNLAAVLCLWARDEGGPDIRYQLLIYPATELRMNTPSQQSLADGYLLTRSSQTWFHQHYLRSDLDREDWRASPLRAPTLAGLPPAFVLTAEYDPLRDEGEAYAQRLIAAGDARHCLARAWADTRVCSDGQGHADGRGEPEESRPSSPDESILSGCSNQRYASCDTGIGASVSSAGARASSERSLVSIPRAATINAWIVNVARPPHGFSRVEYA